MMPIAGMATFVMMAPAGGIVFGRSGFGCHRGRRGHYRSVGRRRCGCARCIARRRVNSRGGRRGGCVVMSIRARGLPEYGQPDRCGDDQFTTPRATRPAVNPDLDTFPLTSAKSASILRWSARPLGGSRPDQGDARCTQARIGPSVVGSSRSALLVALPSPLWLPEPAPLGHARIRSPSRCCSSTATTRRRRTRTVVPTSTR